MYFEIAQHSIYKSVRPILTVSHTHCTCCPAIVNCHAEKFQLNRIQAVAVLAMLLFPSARQVSRKVRPWWEGKHVMVYLIPCKACHLFPGQGV
jgi:hypothetical protein